MELQRLLESEGFFFFRHFGNVFKSVLISASSDKSILEELYMSRELFSYRTLDFFMLRTPLLTMERFKEYFSPDWEDPEELRRASIAHLIELSQTPVIREAIAVSSPSLLESLGHLSNEGNPRKQGQVIKGFMRYLIRMMTRPTPFGLFSGVTYGQFGEQSQIELEDISAYRKRVRPDMEWLLKVVEKIERQQSVVKQLRVQRNSLIYRQGERAKIPYTTRYGTLSLGENDSVSVRASMVFDVVMEVCATPISYLELVNHLQSQFGEASEETIHRYVWELFEQEFLVSSLRPPTTTTDPFTYILSILEPVQGMDELKRELLQICDEIQRYEKLLIGEGEEMLQTLQQKMKQIVDVSSTLQIDMSLEDRSIVLPERIRKDVERVAELLSCLSSGEHDNQHLEEYRFDFLERYGPYREIPLLEMLDDEIGLGPPATYRYPKSRKNIKNPPPAYNTKQQQCMMRWLVTCLKRGECELVLTEDMIQEMMEEKSGNVRPSLPSMELYFLLQARHARDLDSGEYTLILGPNPGSTGAGMTFGRFIDMFGDSFKDMFGLIQQEEQRLTADKLIAEISYLPSAGRATNVVLTENFREYEMGIGTNPRLSDDREIYINDLVVGVDNDRFYIKSLRHNREVIPTAGHMLNIIDTPNVYRFLREVKQQMYRRWKMVDFGALAESPYIPRIRYNNVILSPSTWKIRIDKEQEGEATLELKLRAFCKEWNVPRYVHMIQFDNRILLDLENPLHVDEVCKDLKAEGEIALIEHLGGFDKHPIQRSDGRLIAEFVFPLVRRVPGAEEMMEEVSVARQSDLKAEGCSNRHIEAGQRIVLPGGSWFYAKLYGLDSRQDEFLGRYWEAFCRQCREAGIVDYAYYIRYTDPDRHIRARFHVRSEQGSVDLLPLFYQWTTTLLHEGMISKVVIDTYEPEIERYGGPQLMPLAEVVFSYDSDVSAQLVYLLRFNQIQMSQETVAVLSVVELFRQFGYSDEEMNDVLNKRYDVKEYLDEFRQERRMLMQLLGGEHEDLQSAHTDAFAVYNVLNVRAEAVKRYAGELSKQQDTLTNTMENILLSVIHMHMNRLLGVDRDKERKIMILVRHAVNSLIQYRRKRG